MSEVLSPRSQPVKWLESASALVPEIDAIRQVIIRADCPACTRNRKMAEALKLLREFACAHPESAESAALLKFESSEAAIPDVSILKNAREACIFCYLKHLGTATVLLKEVAAGYVPEKGYPHFALAIAHLSEAENEIASVDSDAASMVRRIRLKLTGQET